MDNKIKTSFDAIRAGDKLKDDTKLFLQNEIAKRRRGGAFLRKYASAFAFIAVLLASGIFTHNLYFTPVSYVDLDVNPSIELTLNRFDRVIGYHAYNGDGDELINALSLTHKSYGEAIVMLMESMQAQGYFMEDALVSVTLQTDYKDKEKTLLYNIQTDIEGYMSGHHNNALVDVFPVSGDTRTHSHDQGVSPAKYLAIQELIEVDPTASVESCRNHSISEIKQLTQEHGNHHGGSADDAQTYESGSRNDEAAGESWQTPHTGQSSGMHGGNDGHHGGRHK